MALVQVTLADKPIGANDAWIDAKRVDRIERSTKDTAGRPITLVYMAGQVRPLRVLRGFGNIKNDLTAGGWGT